MFWAFAGIISIVLGIFPVDLLGLVYSAGLILNVKTHEWIFCRLVCAKIYDRI